MKIAIAFSQVRRGDTVCKTDGVNLRVEHIGLRTGSVVLSGPILGTECVPLGNPVIGEESGGFAEILCLVHRPWPGVRAAPLMQEAILDAIRAFLDASESTKEEKLRAVREAMDAYELGKPLEKSEPKQDLTAGGC